MSRTLSLVLSVAMLGLAAATPAISADRFGLESQLSLKTTLASPSVPDGKKLELDVDQAIAEIRARKLDEDLIRELVKTPSRRPDLDYDVIGGIQSRNIKKALRGN